MVSVKGVRHNRVLDIRKKIEMGWKMEDLISFCLLRLDVSRITALNYIDEAAEPYRKKYQEQQLES